MNKKKTIVSIQHHWSEKDVTDTLQLLQDDMIPSHKIP